MLEESRVPDHAGFGTLGLDSILAAELARRVNDRLGTALRAIDFYDHPTLADLAAAIEGDGANRSAPAPSMAPPPRPELHVLRAVVRGAVAEALYTEPGTIADDAGFHDLGLDSILAVELAKSISTLVSAELRAVEIYETGTVAALTDLLVERGAAAASTPASAEATRMAPATAAPAEPPPEPGQVAQTASAEPIAIIGLAGRFPGAPDIEAFWDLLRAGRDAVTEIPPERWSMDGFFDPRRGAPGRSYARWGGFLDGVDLFDPLFFRISPREAELIDPQERLFLMCAHAAVEHAGWVPGELGGGAVGVFAGVMYGEWALLAAEASTRNDFVPAHAPYWSVPNRVSFTFGWRGPSVALDTACSSSLTALHLACEALRRGECAAAVAGGVNLSLHPRKYLGLSHARFAASDGRCRSFGADGDGYVPGEGVGALVLKRLRDALADGDTVHAVVRGSAIRHGGHTSGFSVPSPGGQAEAIRSALDQAGVLPRTIGYVEAHGTGTALGDPIEIEGLKRAFGGEAAEVAVGSVKSNIGHLEAAAGVAALTKVVLQFRHGELAPSLHAERQNVELDIDGSGFAVARGPARPWPVRRDEGGACAAAARGREFLRRRWRERARGAGRGPAGHAAGRSAAGASARCAFGAFGRTARAPSHRNRADRAGPGRFLRWLGPGRPRSHPSGRSRGVARARRVRGRRPRRAARRPGCARGRAQHAWPPSRARGAECRGWPQGNAGGAVRRPWRRRVGWRGPGLGGRCRTFAGPRCGRCATRAASADTAGAWSLLATRTDDQSRRRRSRCLRHAAVARRRSGAGGAPHRRPAPGACGGDAARHSRSRAAPPRRRGRPFAPLARGVRRRPAGRGGGRLRDPGVRRERHGPALHPRRRRWRGGRNRPSAPGAWRAAARRGRCRRGARQGDRIVAGRTVRRTGRGRRRVRSRVSPDRRRLGEQWRSTGAPRPERAAGRASRRGFPRRRAGRARSHRACALRARRGLVRRTARAGCFRARPPPRPRPHDHRGCRGRGQGWYGARQPDGSRAPACGAPRSGHGNAAGVGRRRADDGSRATLATGASDTAAGAGAGGRGCHARRDR